MDDSERHFGDVHDYDDSYETCERTHAELRIYTGNTDPALITRRLAITPTETRRKGALWRTPSGREKPAKINAWFLSSQRAVDSRDLRRHLDWVLGRLEASASEVRGILDIDGVQASIWCVWWSAHGHGGPTLAPGHLSLLGALGLECCFDVYFAGEDDD